MQKQAVYQTIKATAVKRLLIIALLLPVFTMAQKQEKLTALRTFLKICSGYQSAPLHVIVDIQNNADIAVTTEDTASSTAELYLLAEGTYARLNNMEQVVNDSMLLLINGADKKMVLTPNRTPVSIQLTRIPGMLLQDSSVEKLSEKYTAAVVADDEQGNPAIALTGKAMIGNSSLPKETVLLSYDRGSRLPKEVVYTYRRLVPLSKEEYQYLQQQQEYKERLLNSEDKYFFLLKTHTAYYRYRKIEQDNAIRLPLSVMSCIAKNTDGHYEPVKKYEGYALIEMGD